jgi:hypothetical protein
MDPPRLLYYDFKNEKTTIDTVYSSFIVMTYAHARHGFWRYGYG